MARRLAADGAAVAINYRSGRDAAAAVVRDLTSDGGHAVALQADVSDRTATHDLVARGRP